MHFPSRNIFAALIACGAVLVIALAVLALPNDTSAERVEPSTTTNPPGCAERNRDELPPGVNCQEMREAAAFAVTVDWDRAVDGLNWQNLIANVEAQRAAAERSSSFGGTSYGGSCDGEWAIPSYIVQRESGCSYDAYNATGCDGQGCIGAYQLHAQHFNGGVCSDLGTDPAGQDECARRLWADSPGHWSATL